MSRNDHILLEGEVVHSAAGTYRISCRGGHEVVATLGGKLRRRRIRVVLGDRVTVAVSPYDVSRGLIVVRR